MLAEVLVQVESTRVLGREDDQISHTVGSDLPRMACSKLMCKLLLWGNGFAADHHQERFTIIVEPLNLQAALPVWPLRFRSRYSKKKKAVQLNRRLHQAVYFKFLHVRPAC